MLNQIHIRLRSERSAHKFESQLKIFQKNWTGLFLFCVLKQNFFPFTEDKDFNSAEEPLTPYQSPWTDVYIVLNWSSEKNWMVRAGLGGGSGNTGNFNIVV